MKKMHRLLSAGIERLKCGNNLQQITLKII